MFNLEVEFTALDNKISKISGSYHDLPLRAKREVDKVVETLLANDSKYQEQKIPDLKIYVILIKENSLQKHKDEMIIISEEGFSENEDDI